MVEPTYYHWEDAHWATGSNRDLWRSWDGPPTTRLLRHRRIPGDITLAPGSRLQVEEWVGHALPTRRQEEECSTSADAKYEEVGASLREATRDQVKFPLVLDGNASYGFRRNSLGLRVIGTPIAFVAALLSLVVLLLTVWGRHWPNPWWNVLVSPDITVLPWLAVAAANTLLVFFWLFWVRPSWVKSSANAYAIRLFESVRELRRGQTTTSAVNGASRLGCLDFLHDSLWMPRLGIHICTIRG